MKHCRFEIFIMVVLTALCYFGNFYLKEDLISGVERHSLGWYLLNVLWLFAMIIIGYWGLSKHEVNWIKTLWVVVNFVFLTILFANNLVIHFWQCEFLPATTSTLISTPFSFLMVAYLPRWFIMYKPYKGR